MAYQSFIELNTGTTRNFLLPCPGGYLLVDTGYSHNYKRFLKLLHKHNISVQQIKYLLLTHHHHDHSGFALRLRTQSNCKLVANQKALPYLAGGTLSAKLKPLNACIRHLLFFIRPFMPKAVFEPVEVKPDDIILQQPKTEISDILGYSAYIIHTPGHSDDSISLLLDDGHAFVGDVMMNLPLCGLKKRPFLLEDESQVIQSWKKLEDAGATKFHPAHGKEFNLRQIGV